MNNNYYLAFNKFIFRVPLFPFCSLYHVNFNERLFEEAVYIASPDLYSFKNKQTGKIRQSLYKYYLRASTRPTPFGLFASCSYGKIEGDDCQCTISPPEQIKISMRLDMDYLSALTQYIESIPEIQDNLMYYPNDSIYDIGNKIRYVEYFYKGAMRVHQIQEVSDVYYIKKVLSGASSGGTIDELAQIIFEDGFTIEEAKEFVRQLIASQILKSEIEVYLTGEDAFKSLIKALDSKSTKRQDINNTLHQISKLMDSASISNIRYENICSELIDLIRTFPVQYNRKYLFQTDSYREANAILSNKVVNDIQEVVNFTLKINSLMPYKNERLDDFIEAFENRYERQEVSLQEVLDPDIGIGYPTKMIVHDFDPLIEDIVYPNTDIDSYRLSYIETLIIRKLFEQEKWDNGDTIPEVELSERDFKEFKRINPEDLSPTCKVLLKIKYDNMCNNYTYYIKSMEGPTATNYISRFSYLNDGVENIVERICKKEKDILYDKGILAEIVHLPQSRIGNIAYRPILRDLEIHYLAHSGADKNHAIPVSDLVIGINNRKLYIKSKKFNKIIIPILSNAHNFTINSVPVYLFLCDMQYHYFSANVSKISVRNILDILQYVPRVRYKNVYLFLQTWKLSMQDVQDEGGKVNLDKLKKKNIPKKFVIKDSDNELFIDLAVSECRNIFINMLNKKDLIIEEFLYDDDSSIITDGKNKYCGEFIIPFYKNTNYGKA